MPVIEELGRRADLRFSVFTASRYAPLYGSNERYSVESLTAVDSVCAAGLALARATPIDYVIGATEKSMVAAAHLRAHLGIPGQRVDQALAFTNKSEMKRVLRAADLPVADSCLVFRSSAVIAAARHLRLPVVVKPSVGSGGKNTVVVRDEEELARSIAEGNFDWIDASDVPAQLETLVPVIAEYHCDSVVWNGEVVSASIGRYFEPLIGFDRASIGGSVRIAQDGAVAGSIRDLNSRVISSLGLRAGITHLECFTTADGLVVGEIACRPGGGGVVPMVKRATGVDLWACLVDCETGVAPVIPEAKSALVVGWTWVRSEEVDLETIRGLAGVVDICPESEAGVFVVILESESEEEITQLHERIALARAAVVR